MNQEKEQQTTIDSKYIQQHLANERTFLAWARTAIAMVGIGVLLTNIHFMFREQLSKRADAIAISISFLSVTLSIVLILYATISYTQKRKTINLEMFRSPDRFIITFSVFIMLICILIAGYIIFI